MIANTRADLILGLARVLYVNGQATDQMLAAAERLGHALRIRITINPRWGELQLRCEDDEGSIQTLELTADPTGVDMDRVAAAMRVVEDVEAGRLAPNSATRVVEKILRWEDDLVSVRLSSNVLEADIPFPSPVPLSNQCAAAKSISPKCRRRSFETAHAKRACSSA